MIVYKYDRTIRNKIFNYKQTVERYVEGQEREMNCSCDDSEYIDKDHGHVITGDLSIIENEKLQELFRKGPNHREKKSINWNKNLTSMKRDVQKFVEKWSYRTGIAKVCFLEWKTTVMNLLEKKITRLKKETKFKPVGNVLRDPECLAELQNVHEKYVLVPVDKAANNIGIVCKKYFLEVLKNETATDTYEPEDSTVEDIIEHIREESQKTGIPVEKTFKDLPQIYATIKMHKNPKKFRFIIGSRTCVIKPLAKKLVQILKLVMKTLRRYHNKAKFYTGIERYWIVENNDIVLKNMEKINHRKRARNIECLDFSTLYTKIPLCDLKEKLKAAVDKAFKGGTNQYIKVSKDYAGWNNNSGKNVFSKERIHRMIDVVVDGSFFKFGNKVFRQRIGIPMGVDPAPQMANLYLHYYEAAYIEKLTKEDYRKAKKFNNTSRFIDDLTTLNNDGILEKEKGDIYPKELVLNKENEGNTQATFLDMEIKIEENIFKTRTYDKRDDYDFEIVNFPDLRTSNVPHGAAYGVYTSQVIRYGRVCSEVEDFKDRVRNLNKKLKSKGFRAESLKKTMKKCLHKNHWIVIKYHSREIRKELLNL